MRIFWLLAFGIAWAITIPPALVQLGLAGSSPVSPGLGVLIGVAPLLAAAAAAYREASARSYWRSLARLPRPAWTAALALLLPGVLLAIAVIVHSAAGNPVNAQIDSSLVGYALLWTILAFGEEAGWRGFALPWLADRFGFWTGSTILGVVWCVWHYPKLLGSPYLGSLAEAAPLIGLFSIQIVIANFIVCWLYFRSGKSVVATTIFHASFNLMATAYFAAATDVIITGVMAIAVGAIALMSITVNDQQPQVPV